MSKNVGGIDRILRAVVGLGVIGWDSMPRTGLGPSA